MIGNSIKLNYEFMEIRNATIPPSPLYSVNPWVHGTRIRLVLEVISILSN